MRTIGFACLLFIIISCSKEEDVLSDLQGKWKFQAQEFSGEFEIIYEFDAYYVKSGGQFSIGSENFVSSRQNKLQITGPNITEISLSDSQGLHFVGLTEITFTSDHREMRSKTQSYSECALCPNKVVNQDLKILRR